MKSKIIVLLTLLTTFCLTGCAEKQSDVLSSETSTVSVTSENTVSSVTEMEIITTTTVAATTEAETGVHIDFEEIHYDEYNNKACELPSICALLNHHGIDITPSKFFEYVPTASVNTPAKDVLWQTWDTPLASCYAPVIEIALQGVWVDYYIDNKAVMLSLDKSLDYLLTEYVSNDVPVMVWATIDLKEPEFKTDYIGEGIVDTFEYTNDASCFIITGYDEKTIEAYEPYYGKIETYSKEVFEQRYNDMFKQAIIIE